MTAHGHGGRLFVAVWPPPEVVEALARLERPADDSVRWTTPAKWHVTLRFLGTVDAYALPDVSALRVRQVTLGPVTRRLGRGVLAAPVSGLDDLAAVVGAPEPFVGHLTLARARGRKGRVSAALAGVPVSASWVVDEVTLVRSHLGGGPASYEVLERAALAPTS